MIFLQLILSSVFAEDIHDLQDFEKSESKTIQNIDNTLENFNSVNYFGYQTDNHLIYNDGSTRVYNYIGNDNLNKSTYTSNSYTVTETPDSLIYEYYSIPDTRVKKNDFENNGYVYFKIIDYDTKNDSIDIDKIYYEGTFNCSDSSRKVQYKDNDYFIINTIEEQNQDVVSQVYYNDLNSDFYKCIDCYEVSDYDTLQESSVELPDDFSNSELLNEYLINDVPYNSIKDISHTQQIYNPEGVNIISSQGLFYK